MDHDTITGGISVAEAIGRLRQATRGKGPEVLNISEYRFESVSNRLMRSLPDPVPDPIAAALEDAIHRRRRFEDVLDWIERQPMSWAEYEFLMRERQRVSRLEDLRRGFLPWDELRACESSHKLRREHPVAAGKARFLAEAAPCPVCDTPPDRLTWIYFTTAPETWRNLCGRAGWILVCERCMLQVSCFIEVLN
jgi:hypothetical protein